MLGLKLNHVSKRGYCSWELLYSECPSHNFCIMYLKIILLKLLLDFRVANELITMMYDTCMQHALWFHETMAQGLCFLYLFMITRWSVILSSPSSKKSYYTPRFNEVERGVYWFHVIPPSVHPSVSGQNRFRSVSSTILAGSISYLHI